MAVRGDRVLGSLHTVWRAVDRVTASGEALGPDGRIPVERAMRAVTVDAAHRLGLDHELGTMQAGKLADFVAVSDDPHDVDPMTIRDISVEGPVVGGEIHR